MLLFKKTINTIRYEGTKAFFIKSISYLKRLRKIKYEHSYKDVLIINGCALPHPSRYRVDHQIEQLHFNNYSCDVVFYTELDMERLKYYRMFMFFRCPHTELIEEFILKCRYFNKKTFFDIDDLVIDYKYVKDIKYLATMPKKEYDLYIDGVNRMKKTLELCDAAITTTDRLAIELGKYVKTVFVNRNVASEAMVKLSYNALDNGKIDSERIVIGYFSGSITHNDDFLMILPVIKKLLNKYQHLYLKLVGLLDIPDVLLDFKDQIITVPFIDWKTLPQEIFTVDINISPLENTIFNEAKSENKWLEAALVKVPTIASNVGALQYAIKNGEDGALCSDLREWEDAFEIFINNSEYRRQIGENAFNKVVKNNVTAYTGYGLCKFISTQANENIAFILPSTNVSGGVNVVLKHSNILRKSGLDVTIFTDGLEDDNLINNDGEVNVVSKAKTPIHSFFNKAVATLWTTQSFVNHYPKIDKRYYLVQGFETDFSSPGEPNRIYANLTYNALNNINYITISKWCKTWLQSKYDKNSKYAPNGIDLSLFKYVPKKWEDKIIILIEGDSENKNKNVDESFKIVNMLDKCKFEIWYLSYNGKPKTWYHVDKVFSKIKYTEVGEIYARCHMLLKSSILESFSYPPLEMMATGGIAIVAKNEGNVEYLVTEENCLLYNLGNIHQAKDQIMRVVDDVTLRNKIIVNGLESAKKRDWNNINEDIIELYQ